MKTLVIAAHPNLNESRVNRAWIAALKNHPDAVHDVMHLTDEQLEASQMSYLHHLSNAVPINQAALF